MSFKYIMIKSNWDNMLLIFEVSSSNFFYLCLREILVGWSLLHLQ